MEKLTDKQRARNEIDAVLAKYGVSLHDLYGLYNGENPLDCLNRPDLPKIPRFPYDLIIG